MKLSIKEVDLRLFIESITKIERIVSNNEAVCFCPFHDDNTTPNLALNLDRGIFFCFACSAKGNIFDFIQKNKNCDFETAKKTIFDFYQIPIEKDEFVDNKIVEEFHQNLLKAEDVMNWVVTKKGLSLETIEKYKIGWDKKHNTIPIYDENNNAVNIRIYNQKKKPKIWSYRTTKKNFGQARIYGLPEIFERKDDTIFICEGEWDKLILSQHGYLAVTGTAGAKTFKESWIKFFEGRNVNVLYDCDPEGKLGGEKVARTLFGVAKKVKLVNLPLKGSKDLKDISDFFLKLGHSRDDLDALIENTQEYKLEQESEIQAIEVDSFAEIDAMEFIDKKIKTELTVCGETSEAFHATKKFKVSFCDWLNEGKCNLCDKIFELKEYDKEYIESCMSSDEQVIGMLRRKICHFGRRPNIEIMEKVTVREFFANQRSKRIMSSLNDKTILDDHSREIIERKVYYVSDNTVKPQSYLVEGYVKTHPKTQQVSLLATKIDPLEEEFEAFEVSDETKAGLEKIKALGVDEFIYFLSSRVLKLFKREDLIMGVLLTYFSPLRLNFNKEIIRGWINLAVVGDTDTGKTAAVKRFSEFIGVGDIVSGLSASRTGITYGLKEHKQKGWQIKIGRYPANSRKIVTLDELQFLSIHDIRTLGKAMDEGFVTIDRIAEKTFESMTRLIVLCNPKKDKAMDEHMFGCEAMKDIFDKAIIRRFDFAIFTSHSDIKNFKDLNIDFSVFEDLPFTNDDVRNAVYWAWTREVDNIIFMPETIAKILAKATEISEIFGFALDIPLVAPGDFRDKLARLSASLAILSISTDDFENILVKPEHVDKVAEYLVNLYSHMNIELKEYSLLSKEKFQLSDYEEIKGTLVSTSEKERGEFQGKLECLLYLFKINNTIRRADLAEQTGVSERYIQRKANMLRTFNLIDSTSNGYIKKPKFNKFFHLLSRDQNPGLNISAKSLESGREFSESDNLDKKGKTNGLWND